MCTFTFGKSAALHLVFLKPKTLHFTFFLSIRTFFAINAHRINPLSAHRTQTPLKSFTASRSKLATQTPPQTSHAPRIETRSASLSNCRAPHPSRSFAQTPPQTHAGTKKGNLCKTKVAFFIRLCAYATQNYFSMHPIKKETASADFE